MSDVFVSYKRENLAAVGRLVEALRAEGVGVWWDQDIPPNAPWEATIEQALAAAKLVIVAWSPASVASENVKAEARRARGQGRLLQVFVEACEPPLFFGERQGVDLKSWSGAVSESAFQTVLEAVRQGSAPSPLPAPKALDSQAPPLVVPSKPSIALLPFANLSGDPEQEYFADGMVEEIARALSRCRSLFVIGGASSLAFKGAGTTPQDAARALGVRYILEGSVRKAGGRVRIAVKLVDGADGTQVWADRFEDTLDDIFALQDRVALAVAGVMLPAIQEADLRRASGRPTDSLGSYDLGLRAMALYRSWKRDDVLAALDLLHRAIDLDPNHGPALGMASLCHGFVAIYNWSKDPQNDMSVAQDLASRALMVGRDDHDVLVSVSTAKVLAGDVAAATAFAQRALALNPGSSLAWIESGTVQALAGEGRRAIEDLETGLRLDPFSPWESVALGIRGLAHLTLAEFEQAATALKHSIQAQSGWPMPYALLAAACAQLGDLTSAGEALAGFRARTSIDPRTFVSNSFASIGSSDPAALALITDGVDIALGEKPPAEPR